MWTHIWHSHMKDMPVHLVRPPSWKIGLSLYMGIMTKFEIYTEFELFWRKEALAEDIILEW